MASTVLPPPTAALVEEVTAGKTEISTTGMISDVWYRYFFQNADLLNGGVQGDILFRNATEWTYLDPGTVGQVLMTQGPAADPTWADMIPNFTVGTAFWTDVNPFALVEPPRQMNFNGRAYFGQAAGATPNRNFPPLVGAGWLIGGVSGASWIPRDSDLTSVSAVGGVALSGISRTSDAVANVPGSPPASIGVAGYAINNSTSSLAGAWGLYGEVERHSGAIGGTLGLELDTRNCGNNVTLNPYSFIPSGVTANLWLNTGDLTYGTAATNPTAVCIGILDNATFGYNTGIAFKATSIAGTDGVTGAGIAIDMARGHRIRWMQPPGGTFEGAYIYSTIDGNAFANLCYQQFFTPRSVGWFNSLNNAILSLSGALSGVNGVNISQTNTGNPPVVQAVGSDATIDLVLAPKNSPTGVLRFGAFTASADTPVTGFITIKDQGGTVRHLATVA